MPTHSHRHDDNPGADERPVCFAGHYCCWHGVYREGSMLAVLQRKRPPHLSPCISAILAFWPEYLTQILASSWLATAGDNTPTTI